MFPPLSWWSAAIACGAEVTIATGRSPVPPSRYEIATANGRQLLTVPVKGGRRQPIPVADMEIDYLHDWRRQHWGALYSAYGRAPFFEHFGPELEALLFNGEKRLAAFNMAAIHWIAKSLRLNCVFSETSAPASALTSSTPTSAYPQVFDGRHGFQADLSAIDLLMNEGPYGLSIFKK